MSAPIIRTTMAIDRQSGEIEVTITGHYYRAHRGMKAHPMDRFAPPYDPAEIEFLSAETPGDEREMRAEARRDDP